MEEEIEILDIEDMEPNPVKKEVNNVNNIQNNIVNSKDENERKCDNETLCGNKKDKQKKNLKQWEVLRIPNPQTTGSRISIHLKKRESLVFKS